jgi:hypothetical protein
MCRTDRLLSPWTSLRAVRDEPASEPLSVRQSSEAETPTRRS